MTSHVSELLENYRQAALGTAATDSGAANRWAAQLLLCRNALRETAEGRAGLLSLVRDVEPSVRCWAAAHCLQWAPEVAKPTLEALRDSEGPFGFDAAMTLREYEKGRLSFD